MNENRAIIINNCISAILSILENTEFSIGDGVISTMVRKRNILGVIKLLRREISQIPRSERAKFTPALSSIATAFDAYFLGVNEVETYSRNNGQTAQRVSRLSLETAMRAQKEIEEVCAAQTRNPVIFFHG